MPTRQARINTIQTEVSDASRYRTPNSARVKGSAYHVAERAAFLKSFAMLPPARTPFHSLAALRTRKKTAMLHPASHADKNPNTNRLSPVSAATMQATTATDKINPGIT